MLGMATLVLSMGSRSFGPGATASDIAPPTPA